MSRMGTCINDDLNVLFSPIINIYSESLLLLTEFLFKLDYRYKFSTYFQYFSVSKEKMGKICKCLKRMSFFYKINNNQYTSFLLYIYSYTISLTSFLFFSLLVNVFRFLLQLNDMFNVN